MSWRILLEDIATAHRQQAGVGKRARLAGARHVVRALGGASGRVREGRGGKAATGVLDWGAVRGRHGQVPVEMREGENTEGSAQNITVELSRERTRELLQQVPQAYHTEINEVLLTALGQALGEWSGERRLVVNVEGHGREEPRGRCGREPDGGMVHDAVPGDGGVAGGAGGGRAAGGDQGAAAAMPGKGLGYGLLRYGGDAEAALALAAQPQGEVSFNYLGQFEERYGESRWGRGGEPGSHARRGGSARTCWTCWRW